MRKSFLLAVLSGALSMANAAPLEITDARGANIEEMVKLPVKGLQAIQSKGQIMFVSDNGRFVFTGQVIDLWSKKELSTMKQMRDASETLNFKALGLDPKSLNAISIGTGKNEVVVFVDPYCAVCHKLMTESKSLLKDYTFRFIVVPALGDKSNVLSKQIFCAKDKNKTFEAFTTNAIQSLAQIPNCNTEGYDKTLIAAQILGVEGVPMVIAPNGRYAKGYPAKMAEWLAGNK